MTHPALQRALDAWQAAIRHSFIIHGNINDYTPMPTANGGYGPLLSQLLSTFIPAFDIVMVIEPGRWIDFPNPAHRKLALEYLQGPPSPLVQQLQAQEKTPGLRLQAKLSDVTQLIDRLIGERHTIERNGEKESLRVAVVFRFGDLLFPHADLAHTEPSTMARMLTWARSGVVGEHHFLVMLADDLGSIHAELKRPGSGWEAIPAELPTPGDAAAFIAARLSQYEVATALDVSHIVALCGGLSLMQIEDVIMRAADDGALTADTINERKALVMRQEFGDVLSIQAPRFNLDRVDGYDDLKAYLQRIAGAWKAGRLSMKGMMLLGRPGNGKTQILEALAGHFGLDVAVLEMSKILGQYVGNSERSMQRALDAVLQNGGILIIDEIDQVTGRSSGANRVDGNLFQMLLRFLENPDRIGKVLVFACSNRPDLIDDALRSRFDRVIAVLDPTRQDRAAIIQNTARRLMGAELPADVVASLADATEGWSGRDLFSFVLLATEETAYGATPADAMQIAVECYRPNLGDAERFTALAVQYATDWRALPQEWRERLQQTPAPTTADTPSPADTGGLRKRKTI